jgi:perosamine synthetase
LIGLASCQEANVATPLIRTLLESEHEVRVAWFGTQSAFEHAQDLGLPEVDALISGPQEEGNQIQAAADFASDEWLQCSTILIFGNDVFALILAEHARDRAAKVIRIGAGDRVGDQRDQRRRLSDHAASLWCVSSDAHRQQLLQEGMADEAIAVVGSLTAQVLTGLPPVPEPKQPFLWVALEHADTLGAHGDALMEHCHAAAAESNLSMEWAADAIPASEQLRLARSASIILTDSIGYQELAAAAGIPCIVLSPAGARWDLLASGAVTVADRISDLPLAIARMLQRHAPATTEETNQDPAANILSAMRSWELAASPNTQVAEDPEPPCSQPGSALPTEANASGRTFDDAELRFLTTAIRSGTLNSTRGTMVTQFEKEFAEWLGTKHAIACANGSAAVHCAVASLALQAGDEVITTPITDMGALTPIFYEGAVPVFADVDPATLNVTAKTIEAQLTDRTRAIIVTHLFGNPCEIEPIAALAERHNLPIIEDAAQAFGASIQDRQAGTLGKVAAFSLQQGKHITTGEGGIVCTDDDEIARRVFLFVNKAWGYGDRNPDHYFPALNYRLTELQGAVACAQLPKLDEVIAHRRMIAADLHSRLSNLAGIYCPQDPDSGKHSYWKFAFRVNAELVKGGAVALGSRMRDAGIICAPRYVQKPAFECQLFRDWRNSPVTAMPLSNNPRGKSNQPLFDRSDYPGAIDGLEQVVVLPINERYRPHHIETVANAIQKAHQELTNG